MSGPNLDFTNVNGLTLEKLFHFSVPELTPELLQEWNNIVHGTVIELNTPEMLMLSWIERLIITVHFQV